MSSYFKKIPEALFRAVANPTTRKLVASALALGLAACHSNAEGRYFADDAPQSQNYHKFIRTTQNCYDFQVESSEQWPKLVNADIIDSYGKPAHVKIMHSVNRSIFGEYSTTMRLSEHTTAHLKIPFTVEEGEVRFQNIEAGRHARLFDTDNGPDSIYNYNYATKEAYSTLNGFFSVAPDVLKPPRDPAQNNNGPERQSNYRLENGVGGVDNNYQQKGTYGAPLSIPAPARKGKINVFTEGYDLRLQQ